MTYSLDLREKVIAFIEKGNDCRKAVEIFGVSRDTIFCWLRKKRNKGALAPEPPSNAPKKCPDQELLNYIKLKNDVFGHLAQSKTIRYYSKKNCCFIEKGMKIKDKPF